MARHILLRARDAFAREAAEKAALDSPTRFEERRARMRAALLRALGGLPPLPAVVGARTTGVLAQDGFDVERLLLETLPGAWATANLYLPRGRTGRAPGVLFLCGHAREAKAYPVYQRVCRALARAGMAVLALDPVGQGERMQYLDATSGAERVAWGTTEHAHAGRQCHVAGFGIARYFVADAMQALTYLAARPEVDAARLGVTGNSGGGTQAAYLMFLDDRLACAAPCTYITSREMYIATGQAHDSEQNILGAVADGLNHDDLAGGLAPRPVMVGAVASDFFCVEGTLQTFERLRRVYALYGREQDLHLVVAPGPHGYSDVLRDRATAFFRRYLLGEAVDLPAGWTAHAGPLEAPVVRAAPAAPAPEEVLPAEALQVTRSGQVAIDDPAARTVFDLNVEAWRARRVSPQRSGDERRRALYRWVAAGRPRPPLWVRQTRAGAQDGVWWAHRYTFSEPGVAVPMIELRAEGVAPDAAVTVTVLPEGTPAVAAPERVDTVARLLTACGRLLLMDARGIGAAAQRPINAAPYGARFGTLYTLNYDAMMLGDSLLAMMAFDALRVLEYAHRIAPAVSVAGEGAVGFALLAAAAVDGEVAGGRMAALPRSLADLVEDRYAQADPLYEVFDLAALPDVPELLQWTGVERADSRL